MKAWKGYGTIEVGTQRGRNQGQGATVRDAIPNIREDRGQGVVARLRGDEPTVRTIGPGARRLELRT